MPATVPLKPAPPEQVGSLGAKALKEIEPVGPIPPASVAVACTAAPMPALVAARVRLGSAAAGPSEPSPPPESSGPPNASAAALAEASRQTASRRRDRRARRTERVSLTARESAVNHLPVDIARDPGDQDPPRPALRDRGLARRAALGHRRGRRPRRPAGRRGTDPARPGAGPRSLLRRRGGGRDPARPLRPAPLRRRLRPRLPLPRAGGERRLRLDRLPRRRRAPRPDPPTVAAGPGAGRRRLRARPRPPPRAAGRPAGDRRAAVVGPTGAGAGSDGAGARADRRLGLAGARPQRPARPLSDHHQRPRRLHPPARRPRAGESAAAELPDRLLRIRRLLLRAG